MPFRDCRCPYTDLDKDTFGCQEITVFDLLSAKGDAEKMKRHSRHMLTFNAFENAPIVDFVFAFRSFACFWKWYIEVLY